MRRLLIALALGAGITAQANGTSLTMAGLVDDQNGTSFDLDGVISATNAWSIGAGVGHSESKLTGDDFSGKSLRMSADLQLDAFSASAAAQRWEDSGQLESTTIRGQLGWTFDSGLSLAALMEDRSLGVTYTATVLGQQRERKIDFDGTGVGVDVSYFGAAWNVGLRYVDYDYGRSVDRVRAVLDASSTVRFPRLKQLIASEATRAVGAPDRALSATLGRQFGRGSLQADWGLQRDALTGDEINSYSATFGFEPNPHVQIDTTLGISEGGDQGSIGFASVALTLRR